MNKRATTSSSPTSTGDKETVTSARSARMEIRGEDRIAVLSNGQRLETTRNQPGLKISELRNIRPASAQPRPVQRKSFRQNPLDPCPAGATRAVQLAELAGAQGWHWLRAQFRRAGAGPGQRQPRAARSTSMVLALFAFIVYYNLMTLGQSWVGSGRMGLVPFMAAAAWRHAGQAGFAWRYGNQWTPGRLWAQRSPA